MLKTDTKSRNRTLIANVPEALLILFSILISKNYRSVLALFWSLICLTLLWMLFSHSVVSYSLRPQRTAAHQPSLSFTIAQSLLRLMSIEPMMPSNHLSSATLFSSCPQSLPSGSFPMSQLLSLNLTFVKFNHVIACSGSLFILIADFHFACFTWLINSTVDRHLWFLLCSYFE